MSDTTRIMVVEDEAIVAMGHQAKLENLGYAVVSMTSSGEEAIVHAADLKPDLVLMDIRLDGTLDGIQAAEQIRVRYDIPVVYVTAYSDTATLQRAKVTGPYSYLIKPVEERTLHTAVEIALFKHGMEKVLTRSEQLTAAGVIATGIAHEIVGPLTRIQVYCQMLVDSLEGSLKNDAIQIYEEVQRATKMVADLPSLVREQAQKPPKDGPRWSDFLTPQQGKVLRLIVTGESNAEIAEDLVILPNTVASHVANIYERTGCKNRVSLALWAINHGLVSPHDSEQPPEDSA